MLVEPIDVATIRGERLRFFKTPANDGAPDFPWHSVEDLRWCMKLPRDLRRLMLRVERGSEFKNSYRDVATADGIVTIAPHFVAQAILDGMSECFQRSFEEVERGYTRGSFEAYKQLTAGIPSPHARFEYMAAAFHRHDSVEG